MKQCIRILLISSIYNVFCFGNENFEILSSAIDVFEQQMALYMEQDHVPGFAIVVTQNGSTIYKKGIGYKDRDTKEPVTTDTLFRLSSNTKMLTAIAIMQIWEKGFIALDEPVINYLPWFKQKDSSNRWKNITVRHLLNHTAGISRCEGSNIWGNRELLLTGSLLSSEEMISSAINQEVVADPGSCLKYSNLGYWILSQIIAEYGGAHGKTADEKYVNYIKENILTPLHLDNSGYVLDATEASKLAKPYGIIKEHTGIREALPLILNPKGLNGGWGVYSSADDLSKLLIWLTSAIQGNSAPLLKSSTMAMMISNPIDDPNSSDQYGLGIKITSTSNGPIMGHAGMFFGYLSWINIDVKTGLGVAILLNIIDDNTWKYLDLAFKTIGKALQGQPPEIPIIEQIAPIVGESSKEPIFLNIVGYYEYPFGYFTINENSEGTLLLDNLSMNLISKSSRQIDFKLGWEGSFTDINGENISFYLDDNGEVESLMISNTVRCYRIRNSVH